MRARVTSRCFVEDAGALLRATRRLNETGRFVWIASDGWGKEELPVLGGNEVAAEGALTIELQSARLPEFDGYFRRLRPATNDRNPWFREVPVVPRARSPWFRETTAWFREVPVVPQGEEPVVPRDDRVVPRVLGARARLQLRAGPKLRRPASQRDLAHIQGSYMIVITLIGAEFHGAMVATAPGEKLLPVGRRSLSNWTAVRYQTCSCAENYISFLGKSTKTAATRTALFDSDMHQIVVGGGLIAPDPTGGACSADREAVFRGPTSK